MIYSDGVHLISDVSVDDLHFFCRTIGIKRCWFHSGSRFSHYDIPQKFRADFFEKNPIVQKVTSRQIVEILKRARTSLL
jgi:hypothetical protein